MNIHDFTVELTKDEGGAEQQSIAQIKETIAKADARLGGNLYQLIRTYDPEKKNIVICDKGSIIDRLKRIFK
jgi:hypothetical protein